MADKKAKKPDEPEHPDPDQPTKEPPKHDSHGREHEVHRRILERRMSGGQPADSAAYQRALEQWKELPGSIVRPPSDISSPEVKEREIGNCDEPAAEEQKPSDKE